MPGTEKLVSLLTSSSMFFKLHLWDVVSGVQVRFIPFYSSRNPWCDLFPAKAYISPAPLSWKVFFSVTVLTLHLCLLWYIFPPPHLSCGVCWNEPLFIFKGQSSAQGSIWHLLAAEGVGVQCCPTAEDASQAWMVAPWCQAGREWVLYGELSGRGVQRTNMSVTAGKCRCVYQARGRRLAGHRSKHFLIQRQVSLLIGQ